MGPARMRQTQIAGSRTPARSYSALTDRKRLGARSSVRLSQRGAAGASSWSSRCRPPDPRALEHEINSLKAEPEHLLEEASRLLRGHDVEISTRVEDAEPVEALVATACETDAALIVVGAYGDSYLARALRGSAGEKLVARAPCDLLVAR